MATGTIHKLGTLYIDGKIIPRSTKPWPSSASVQPSEGNLFQLPIYGYGKKPTIEIRDTDAIETNQIQWVEINDGSDQFLIADRNLCSNITYNFLKENKLNKSLGEGKIITIDGGTYELFMLSAGENNSVQSGVVTNNQWDKYVGNCADFQGLPTPTAQDMQNTSSIYNFNTTHNQLWNWAGCFSWSNYEYTKDNSTYTEASVRGNLGARKWDRYNANFQGPELGWRPALKVLSYNHPPEVIPDSKSFGNLSEPQNISFSVSDPDGDYFNVMVYIDSNQKEAYTSQTGTKYYTLELSRYWSDLNIGSHNIEIYTVDNSGLTTSKIYTFTKTNAIPTITPSSQYLGSLTQPKDFNFTIYDADNDKMTLTFKIDQEILETWSQQSNGQKTASILTKYWSRTTIGSHTVYITATDPYDNSTTAVYTFDKSNNPPVAPTILSPLNNERVNSDFYVEFNIGSDPEEDSQLVKVQIADNQSMTSGLQEFTSIEKYTGSSWTPISGVLTNNDSGSKLRTHITGISSGVKYIRISSYASVISQYVYSSIIKINVGESYLEIMTHPSICKTMPNKIVVLLSLVAGSQTQKVISVCNNANDSVPTWENYSPDSSGLYTFTNKTKTADDWAVSAKVKVTANNYTGEISLSAIGLGVL
jgi:hypothetical protein